jgi:hypothetical protein
MGADYVAYCVYEKPENDRSSWDNWDHMFVDRENLKTLLTEAYRCTLADHNPHEPAEISPELEQLCKLIMYGSSHPGNDFVLKNCDVANIADELKMHT